MAETKFGQLQPGQLFRWKDGIWQKTSPILARREGEENAVLVPRSTVVELMEQSTWTQETDPGHQIMLDLQAQLTVRLEKLPLAPDQKKDLLQDTGLLISQATDRLQELLQHRS